MTVGISRSRETPAPGPARREVLAAGAARDTLELPGAAHPGGLDPAVEEVIGYTRYRIEATDGRRHRPVVDRGGVAASLLSRTARDPRAAGHQAPGATRTGGDRGHGPQRRTDGDPRARGEGREVTG